jgi:hypothetical protein
VEAINKLLDERTLDYEVLLGVGVAEQIDAFERLDRIIGNAESRRIAALRELERRRTTLRGPDVPRLRAPAE